MTNITSGYTGQYYQLPTSAGGTTSLSGSSYVSGKNSSAVDTDAVNNSLAYLLDLSPQARSYLNATTANSASNFILNSVEQGKITDILTKYKNEPVTQETYNKIQGDLQAAGLSAQQLAQKESLTRRTRG